MTTTQLNLFPEPTSRRAHRNASRLFTSRRAKIIELLTAHGPLTIFEIAQRLGCHDHQISGRFSAMEADGEIIKTGKRRPKPDTGCECEVYGLPGPSRARWPD